MANNIVVDSTTLSAAKRPYKKWLLPGIAALLVLFVGLMYVLSQAATEPAVKVYPKIVTTSNGFYNSTLGKSFVPRGANFVRLATSPSGNVYHSTFEPGQYKSTAMQSMLISMKKSGYNTVRVFIDHGEFATPSHGISTAVGSTVPIKPEYMANVVDFIKQAINQGIYTIPVLDGVPANTYYYKIAGSPSGNIKGNNVLYLDPRYVQAKELYVKEFTKALKAGLGEASNAVLAYQTDNEVFFEANQPPFSTMSGSLTSLDGLTYDMSKPDRRQQAADANLVIYATRMKRAITSVEPQALLTLGFFTNRAVGKTAFNGARTYCSTACAKNVDYRFPGRPASVSIYSQVDFIDMHAYINSTAYSLKTDLTTSEYTLFKKPFLLGEFGALKAVYKSSVTNGAIALKNMQIASCGLGTKGWLFWTWDTNLVTSLASQKLFYSLAETNGAVNGQLAPIVRPNPCK